MVEQMPGTESGNESGYVQEGWRVAHLGALGTVRYGLGQPPEQDIDGLPMIRATNIKRGRIVADGLIRIKKSAIPESRDPYLRSGDIIVVRSGAYTGDLAMVTPEWEGCVAGYDLVFSPSNRVDPEFCAFALLSGPIQTYFRSQRDRSAQPHLNRQQLESAGLPLPPLPEQHAIAHVLRTVQRAKEATEKVITATCQLKASLMRHLFTYGPVPVDDADRVPLRDTDFGKVPNAWRISPLDESSEVQTGVTKGRRLNGADVVSVPYLRVANVQDGFLDLAEMKNIDIRRSEVARYSLQPGDVVLTEGGDFDKLGRGFIWNGEVPGCVHQNHIFAVRAKRSEILPGFLAYLTVKAHTGRRISSRSLIRQRIWLASIHQAEGVPSPLAIDPRATSNRRRSVRSGPKDCRRTSQTVRTSILSSDPPSPPHDRQAPRQGSRPYGPLPRWNRRGMNGVMVLDHCASPRRR